MYLRLEFWRHEEGGGGFQKGTVKSLSASKTADIVGICDC